MQASRWIRDLIVLILALLCLSACSPILQSFLPTATPQPTLTPLPSIGQMGQRMEWGGWAVSVTGVLRTSLNPRELNPYQNRPGDQDYITVNLTVERTADEEGSVYGEDFSLVDEAGTVYSEDPFIQNWIYYDGKYFPQESASGELVIPVPKTAQGLKLRFTPRPELPAPIEISLDRVEEPIRVDLREAIEMGLLSAEVSGLSLESIEIEVEVSLEVEDSIELTIAPGTMFLAPSPDLQTMVVRQEMVLYLEPKREVSVKLEVACANMTLKAPGGGETYIVQIEPPAEELRKLLGLPEFQDGSFRLQQFAVWVITDNPPPGGFVGLGSGGQGSPPSTDELAQIRAWFEKAGIAVENYAGLR